MPQPPHSKDEPQDREPTGVGEPKKPRDENVGLANAAENESSGAGNDEPDSKTSRRQMPAPQPRRRKPSSSKRMLGLVAVVAIGLTVYMFLEHNVFSHNRPLIWASFDSAKIEYAHENGAVVVLLVGPFQTNSESTQLVELIDISPVRAQAHRIKNRFCVVPNPESKEEQEELNQWLDGFFEPDGIEQFIPPGRPYFLILTKSSDRPIVIDSNGDPAGMLAERLREIRIQ